MAFYGAPGSVRDDAADARRWRHLRKLFRHVRNGGQLTIERHEIGSVSITVTDRHGRRAGAVVDESALRRSIDDAIDDFIVHAAMVFEQADPGPDHG